MAARYGTEKAAESLDQAMHQLRGAVEQMRFARYRFSGQHRDVTRAVATLSVALQDVLPYLAED